MPELRGYFAFPEEPLDARPERARSAKKSVLKDAPSVLRRRALAVSPGHSLRQIPTHLPPSLGTRSTSERPRSLVTR